MGGTPLLEGERSVPVTLPKPCLAPGCPATTTESRCPAHQRRRQRRDRKKRGSAAARGYDRRHRRWRQRILDRDPFCVECLKEGRKVRSEVADHIVPIREGGARFAMDNGQGLCQTHHNRKTVWEREAGRV